MAAETRSGHTLSRRSLLRQVFAVALGGLTPLYVFAATRIEAARSAIRKLVGERETGVEGIRLTTPAIAENGNTVPISVAVDSPFTSEDYVRAIHVFAEQNPLPEVITFHYSPRSGRAENSTRIRLARTQRVIAIAEMSDGRVLRAANEVKVTIGGCGG